MWNLFKHDAGSLLYKIYQCANPCSYHPWRYAGCSDPWVVSRLSIVMHRQYWRGGPQTVRLLVISDGEFDGLPFILRQLLQLDCCYSLSLLSPSSLSSLLSSSLPVAMAKLIVAVTISIVGLHFASAPYFCSSDHPPSRYDVSPHCCPARRRISPLKLLHLGHLNKKWSTDSSPWLHLHCSVSTLLILANCLFNRFIPERSWQRTLACSFTLPLYRRWVCGPGNALSKDFVNLPTFALWDLLGSVFNLPILLRPSLTLVSAP